VNCLKIVKTNETADWYIKGKYKCYYAHQVGMMFQLASSGAPVGCVVLSGKQYESDSLKPLLVDVEACSKLVTSSILSISTSRCI